MSAQPAEDLKEPLMGGPHGASGEGPGGALRPAMPDDLDAKILVEEMRQAFRSGITRDLEWRKQQLRRLAQAAVERQEELLGAVAKDLGRGLIDTLPEVVGVKKSAENAIKNLHNWTRPLKVPTEPLLKPAQSEVVPEPYGVVLIIGPWNFPVSLVLEPLIGAIAAGNAVVVKPSEVAESCAAALGSVISDYLDPKAVRVVQGGPEVAVALLQQHWDYVFFIGGTEIGRKVAVACAQHLTPVTLELGGRNPVYLDDSVDLKIACKRLLWGMNMNAGQICLKPKYVLVNKSFAPKLVEKLKESVVEMYGEDPSKSRDMARIINKRHVARLRDLVSDPRVSECVVFGGTWDVESRYFSPTLLLNVPWECPIMEQETFGPIMVIQPVESVEEAISLINARPKPLCVYVFSTRGDVIQRIISNTSSGGVCTNDTIMQVANPHLPFGGVGDSGMGAYHGKYSFDCFTHQKALMKKGYSGDQAMRYPPSDVRRDRIMTALLTGDLWGLLMLLLGFRK